MVGLLLLVVVFFVLLLPVKLAAMIVGAKRTGFGWCFVASIVAGFLHVLGLSFPGPGNLVSVLLGAAGYSAILKTSYAGGLAITVLHFIIALILYVVLLPALFGTLYTVPRLSPVI